MAQAPLGDGLRDGDRRERENRKQEEAERQQRERAPAREQHRERLNEHHCERPTPRPHGLEVREHSGEQQAQRIRDRPVQRRVPRLAAAAQERRAEPEQRAAAERNVIESMDGAIHAVIDSLRGASPPRIASHAGAPAESVLDRAAALSTRTAASAGRFARARRACLRETRGSPR